MDNKFLVACCVFSLITGMFIAHMIEKDRACKVTFSKGNEVHVMVGK